MKLKAAYILLFSVVLQNAFSGNRIDIYLSLNDCLNHYSALSSLSSLRNFEKNILIRHEDSLLMHEVLEEYALSGVNYRYIKSLPFSEAYYKVFLNDRLVDSLSLSLLPEKVKRYASAGDKSSLSEPAPHQTTPGQRQSPQALPAGTGAGHIHRRKAKK